MVDVKVNLNGVNALTKLGVLKELVDWIAANGKVKLTPSEFRFIVGDYSTTVPVTLNDLNALNAGTIGTLAKVQLRGATSQAIKDLQAAFLVKPGFGPEPYVFGKAGSAVLQAHIAAQSPPGGDKFKYTPAQMAEMVKQGASANAVFDIETVTGSKDFAPLPNSVKVEVTGHKPPVLATDGALSLLPDLATAPTPEEEITSGAVVPFKTFDLKQKNTAPCIPLAIATALYQPVKGTSPGSRYWVVGVHEDLRIAARYHGGELSFRIEGPNWFKHEQNIVKAGFNKVSKVKGYCSLHVSVGSDAVLAAKTLGAILAGLGLQLSTPLPQLSQIVG